MIYLLLGFRWLLAAVLVTFGGRKLLTGGIDQLAADMANYRVLPDSMLRSAAITLPWVEVATGLCLALGILLVPASVCAGALLGGFTVVIAWHLSRGHQFRCGCGDDETISWIIVARDLALCVAAVMVAAGPSAGLAIWAGWGAGHVSASAGTLLPVPLLTILIVVFARIVVVDRRLQATRSTDKRSRWTVA
jgi:uncharacterized membrane protein YphA (DoxX/SURF4 family)